MPRTEAVHAVVLILAPTGRDAEATEGLIRRVGLAAAVCADLDVLVARLGEDVAAVILAEEALYGQPLGPLEGWVGGQPRWSDLQFLVLTSRNDGPKFAAFRRKIVAALRNVSFLERPLHAITLQTSVLSAERSRQHQYRVRAYFEAEKEASSKLEALVATRTEELKRANDQLRSEIERGERTHAALLQAQKIETMGQLVGGVAHDFNNLLMAVIGNLDLLRKRLGPDRQVTRLLDGAVEGARRGATLTQRLLAFARKQELRPRPTDVTSLLKNMKPLIDGSLGPLVPVKIRPNDRLPAVMIDPNQLEMAILNLTVNARDAMPSGGLLTIGLQACELTQGTDALRAGRYLQLSVSDTGEGMDADTLARAVEPFYSTKGVGKGTGLGLSMVDGLANQSGGAFQLESAKGKGTTAILWLPVIDRPPEPAPEIVPAAVNDRRATILVVDDDVLIATSTHALLEDLGHTVAEAHSGPVALGLISGGLSPDLVITDYAMPGMTGVQLAHGIRALLPGVPILLATGYADLRTDAPIDLPRLAKPYTQNQLAAEIKRLLERVN